MHASTIDKYMKYKRIFGFYDENYKGKIAKILKQHFKGSIQKEKEQDRKSTRSASVL